MRRRRARWASVAAVAVAGPSLWTGTANAHGVELDIEQAEAVQVEAMYDSGEPMADAQVSVYSPQDSEEPWISGTLDEQGRFLFVPSREGPWEVEVRQAGHGGVVEILVEEEDSASEEEESANGGEQEAAGEQQEETGEEGQAGTVTGEESSGGTGFLQLAVMAALAVWGCVGTALYAMSRRRA